jgi:hypothetical protein
VPPGPVTIEFDDVRFAYPSADKVSLASLEEVSTLDTRGGEEVLHGISFTIQPGQTVALVGTSVRGSRRSPSCWRAFTTSTAVPCALRGWTSATSRSPRCGEPWAW